MGPELTTHPLTRADGSATFSNNLFTVLAAVNGPIEVQRRDELPEEAAIEVNIRPASGVGGPRERWLESVIAALLRTLVLVKLHPRTLVQVTLQVTKEPTTGVRMKRAVKDVAIIPALANAAFLALVDGAVPMGRTMVAGLACLGKEVDGVTVDPTEKQVAGCRSVHAMAYSAKGELLLDESVGRFDAGELEDVGERLRVAAIAAVARDPEDESMSNGDAATTPWLRQAVEEDVKGAGAWREPG